MRDCEYSKKVIILYAKCKSQRSSSERHIAKKKDQFFFWSKDQFFLGGSNYLFFLVMGSNYLEVDPMVAMKRAQLLQNSVIQTKPNSNDQNN